MIIYFGATRFGSRKDKITYLSTVGEWAHIVGEGLRVRVLRGSNLLSRLTPRGLVSYIFIYEVASQPLVIPSELEFFVLKILINSGFVQD